MPPLVMTRSPRLRFSTIACSAFCRLRMGAISMKFVAGQVLRRFGFRTVLVFTTLAGSAFLAVNALFTAQTPHWLIFAVFVAAGFLRSLQFTSVNSLAYADVPETEISRASTLSNVAQQLSLSLGVAVAAFVLEAALEWARSAPGD